MFFGLSPAAVPRPPLLEQKRFTPLIHEIRCSVASEMRQEVSIYQGEKTQAGLRYVRFTLDS
jgi:hypothetical protein